ncbi:MAG: hypothetical protein FWF22_06180 [Treponema sp.]|nr:hypothetical protein [Treponema sp.]
MGPIFNEFIQNASNIQKGLFVMVAGLLFVFAVQIVFFLVIKLWPRGKKEN